MDSPQAIPRTLLTLAEDAVTIASGFHQFPPHFPPDLSAECNATIATLFSLSASLKSLTEAIRKEGRPGYRNYDEKLKALAYSLDYTLKDVTRILGDGMLEGRNEGWSNSETYDQIWQDLQDFCRGESKNTLGRRLEFYERLIKGLQERVSFGSVPSCPMLQSLDGEETVTSATVSEQMLMRHLQRTTLPRLIQRSRWAGNEIVSCSGATMLSTSPTSHSRIHSTKFRRSRRGRPRWWGARSPRF